MDPTLPVPDPDPPCTMPVECPTCGARRSTDGAECRQCAEQRRRETEEASR
jgi:ribosomal protein L40E